MSRFPEARTRSNRYTSFQRGLPTPACVCLDPITFPPAPRRDVIRSGDDDKQPVACRCRTQDGVSSCGLAVTQITPDD